MRRALDRFVIKWLFLLAGLLFFGACAQPAPSEPVVAQATAPPTSTITDTATPLPSATNTAIPPTETSTPTHTLTPSLTPTATQTETPTLTPTYAILRGQVIPERANCRYGPGASYLYKYGLVGGSNLEIIGRNKLGIWLLIQAIGGDNPCWVKAELMDVRGDVMSVEPVDMHIIMPWSPYYGPLKGVSATRQGEIVTVFWSPLELRPGDDAEQVPYLVEAWVCRDGDIVFDPVGAYGAAVEIVDQPGCDQPSRGQVLAAEKHGYTIPVEIQWPE